MKLKSDNVVINSSARPSSQRATIPTTLTIWCLIFSGFTLFTTFPSFATYVPLTGVKLLSSGYNYVPSSNHNCVVTNSGGVKCWGSTAVDVTGLTSGVTAIALGSQGGTNCALTNSGGVKCWGSTAVDVTGLTSGVTAITSGGGYACALTSSGGVKCWGLNYSGQLGNNSTTYSSVPVDVTGLTSGVTAFALIGYTALRIDYSCVLTSNSGVKCWGDNQYGQLGNNSTTNSSIPVDVTGLTSGVTAVALAERYACALISSGGVKCWGDNYSGQLGNNSTTSSSIPVDVTGLTSRVTAIALQVGYACALTSGGGVKCWGWNNYGTLGNNSTTNSSIPVDVMGLTSGVMAIAAGPDHACALTNSGGVKCWGRNYNGQLGNNSTTDSSIPVDVTGLTSGITAIASDNNGQSYTCALTGTGGVKCWGANWNGQQLGNNSTTNSSVPVDVLTLLNDQTITFNPPTTGSSSNTATLSATATSDLPVTFTSTTPTVCTISGTTLNLVGTGACTVTADQAGDANYAAATTVTQTIYAAVKEIPSPPVVIYQPATTPPATPLLTLFLQLEGNGSGTINTNPVSKCTSQTGCSYTLAPNTTLTLTPVADADSVFTHWSGSKECLTGQLQLTIPTLCIAHFQRLYSLTLTVQGQGQVTSYDLHQPPRNSLCGTECQDPYSSDSLVYVQATPDKGMSFQGWGGDCNGNQNPYLVAMTKKLKCQANFVAAEPVVPPSKPKETPPPPAPTTTCPPPTSMTETTTTPSTNMTSTTTPTTPPSTTTTTTTPVTTPAPSPTSPIVTTTTTPTVPVTTPVTPEKETKTPEKESKTPDKDAKTTDKDAKTTGNLSTAVTTSPATTITPVASTTPPVVTTPPPVVTTPPPVIIAASTDCATTGNINGACDYKGREVTSLEVPEGSTVANATVKTSLVNDGWVSNVTVSAEGKLTGGVLTGYIKNEGTLLDFDFKGMSIIGGTLGGVITNTSRVGGYFQDVTLLPKTTITGGTLQGTIRGDKKSPALLEDVRIKKGSKLSGVKLGKGVKLEKGVVVEDKQ